MAELPRVHEILSAVGPLADRSLPPVPGKSWDAIFLRGRLVEACATLLAEGKTIEAAWWSRTSDAVGLGHQEDMIAHEECRPYVEATQQFLHERPVWYFYRQPQTELHNHILGYKGHPDWIVCIDSSDDPIIVDLKCGEAPTANSPYDLYCSYQLQLYSLAYMAQHTRHLDVANLYLQPDGRWRWVSRRDMRRRREAELLAQYFNLQRSWNHAV